MVSPPSQGYAQRTAELDVHRFSGSSLTYSAGGLQGSSTLEQGSAQRTVEPNVDIPVPRTLDAGGNLRRFSTAGTEFFISVPWRCTS